MAKGNKKATMSNSAMLKKLTKGFDDYEDVFDLLIDQSEQMNMLLLAESLRLSKSILRTYKKGWEYGLKNNVKA